MTKIYIEGKDKGVPECDFFCTILATMNIATDKYEIIPTGGYKNLMDSKTMPFIEVLRANTDVGGKNLVVFDADTEKNNGGFAVRQEYLIKRRDELNLEFDLFLWPDNKSDGDVEVLMESIARTDLYPEFFDCFAKYEHCMSQRKNEDNEPFYSSPNRKGKLHTYFNALPISNAKKKKFGHGVCRWGDQEIWNMESKSLVPIKEFLLERLG